MRGAVGAQSISDRRHFYIADHPAFVPAGLIVDNEQTRDIGPPIDECTHVVRVGGQTGFGFEAQTDSTQAGHLGVGGIGAGGNRAVIDARDQRGKHVGLEIVGVQQVILKELSRVIGLGERRHRQKAMRSRRHIAEPVLERRGQVDHVSAVDDCLPVYLTWTRLRNGASALATSRQGESHQGQQETRGCNAHYFPGITRRIDLIFHVLSLQSGPDNISLGACDARFSCM